MGEGEDRGIAEADCTLDNNTAKNSKRLLFIARSLLPASSSGQSSPLAASILAGALARPGSVKH
jgi:hypothetical protein